MRFKFDKKKSQRLKNDPRRNLTLAEAREIWLHNHYVDCRSDDPEQFRAIGWAKETLYTVIYEVREDELGEYYHLVTLWKSTKEEVTLYENNI